ncbi:Uncharacterized protease YegQ [hydrothermal vent metagenome]|uniref:Uncharacterized protease YegQ n=1 Tax=hydrothermal vent metagenome TaxID=652676 RepID=A0A3B0YIZ2_9ZZZZ
MNSAELLAPAGTLKHLEYALAFGADAVYAGMPRYSLRVRNNDFSKIESLQQGIEKTHQLNKLFFLACNVIPHNAKIKTFIEDMTPIVALKPDALIMADPGLIMMVREMWPEVPIHLSVQANTMNYASVKFWESVGIKRIILSRELSLDQVEEIRQLCPDIELEVFVHGALCMAYSGRCLLSGYMNHRDANQGSCTNACRWEYKVHNDDKKIKTTIEEKSVVVEESCCSNTTGNQSSSINPAYKSYFLEESNRPGELMPIEEDENGTYIMNSKDLRAVEHVERLLKIGINCLKIEGRTKSHYYVARSTQAYRKAIDDATNKKPFDPSLISGLENLANRGYTSGFFERHPDQDYQNYLRGYSKSDQQIFVGELLEWDLESKMAFVEVKNKFSIGDELELISPSGNQRFTLNAIENEEGEAIEVAPGSGHRVKFKLEKCDSKFALFTRQLT